MTQRPDGQSDLLVRLRAAARNSIAREECEHAIQEIEDLRAEIASLRTLVARLPQDASGRRVIAHEDELFHPKFPGGSGYYDGEQVEFYCGHGDYDYYPVAECWPTKDAAEKARTR